MAGGTPSRNPAAAPADDGKPQVWLGLLSLAFLAGACFFGWEAYAALRARSWPQADGRVLSTKLWERQQSGGMYKLDVRYNYSVGGQSYTGDRYYPHNNSVGRDGLRLYDQFNSSGACKVRYDPSDPARSCLEPQDNLYVGSKVGLVLLLGLPALAGIYFALPRRPVGAEPGGMLSTGDS